MGQLPSNITKSTNILLVSSKYFPEYSGSGLRAHNTYKRLSKKFGIKFEVLCGSVMFTKGQNYIYEDVEVCRVTARSRLLFASNDILSTRENLTRSLWDRVKIKIGYIADIMEVFRHLFLRRKNYDLIHIFGSSPVTSGAVSFAKIFNIPFILEITSDRSSPHVYEPLFVKLLKGNKFPSNSRIVCGSEKQEQMCFSHGYDENVWSRPHPVDESRFYPDISNKRQYLRKYTEFSEEDRVLSYVAKFMPTKNQIFMLEVMKFLPNKYKLVMAGPVVEHGPMASRDMEYFQKIRDGISNQGLVDRVKLVKGFVEFPEEFMKMADVYVLPSTDEGLPNPMLEAVASGIPVVANNMEGITDTWIRPGKNGFVSSLVPEEFANNIIAAVSIRQDSLVREASRTHSLASTKVLDLKYRDIIDDLVKSAG